MKKTMTLAVMLFTTIGLLLLTVSNTKAQDEIKVDQSANDVISILAYSFQPVGYVSGERFIQCKCSIELKNNEGIPHSFNIRIIFYDKDNNILGDIIKKVSIKANKTKKYSNEELLEPDMAKQITTTKAFIEDIH